MITHRPELARAVWRASSYSAASGNCLQLADLDDGARAVRDSKDPAGPVLTVTTAHWSAFIGAVHFGEFD